MTENKTNQNNLLKSIFKRETQRMTKQTKLKMYKFHRIFNTLFEKNTNCDKNPFFLHFLSETSENKNLNLVFRQNQTIKQLFVLMLKKKHVLFLSIMEKLYFSLIGLF